MTDPRTTGATAAGAKDKRTLWPWLLLAAIIAGLLIWWLVESLDDDDLGQDPTTEIEGIADPPEDEIDTDIDTDEDAPTSPVPDVAVPVGAILVADLDLLDPAIEPTGDLVGEQVEANMVEVAEVVADEAFYVGPEQGNTILVRLPEFAGQDSPESPFQVEAGDQVSFTGTLQEIDEEFLDELALFQGTPELETGDYYVRAEEFTPAE